MTITEPSTFGALLRQHRLAAGLTQEALAERASLSLHAISNLERGERRQPYPHTVRQLARALRLSAADRARLEATIPPRRGSNGVAAAAPAPATNLPLALTSFVGRERELAEVRRLLGGARLVTLTGAGGVGKTRLALEAARAALADYPDGVWLVELAALADADLVASAAARALGVPERPGRSPTEALASWLGGKRLLLVLDNCEHLLDACARLAEALLQRCARLCVLATSRQALGIAGQIAWRVPSLAMPSADRPPPTARLAAVAAVRLFVDRARAVRPGFAVGDRNAAAVARVCRRLDGLPLAIELAAALVAALSVEAIAARLDDRFRLLTGGGRTSPRRQQTLRATLDWSHDLLTEPERALLRRLAVFAGGWTLEAAEAVGAGDGVDGADVLGVLVRLVDQSLVLMEVGGDGAARYRLLETVRQYAWERLGTAGEEAVVRERHAAWCLALAEAAAPHLEGPAMGAWLPRLDAEHANVRAALAWSLDHDPSAGLQLVGGLTDFWYIRAHYSEGRRWFESLLARAPGPTAARARALAGASLLARLQGDHAAARVQGEASLALSRALGDARSLAQSLIELGAAYVVGGDLAPARTLLQEGVALSRARGDAASLGQLLYFLGRLAKEQGEYGRARALLEECLALRPAVGYLNQAGQIHVQLGAVTLSLGEPDRAEALLEEALLRARRVGVSLTIVSALGGLGRAAAWRGDLERAARLGEESLALAKAAEYGHGIGTMLIFLGQVACHRGDLARALAWLEDGLALSRAMGTKRRSGEALHGLGKAAWRQGEAARAAAHLRESVVVWRELGDRLGIAECLEGLATVAAGSGGPERAARMLGAAEALREAVGAPLPPVDRPGHEATMAATRAAMDEASFIAAWADGRALPPEEAVAEVLAVAAGPVAGHPDAAPPAPGPAALPDGLTAREGEVLRLLAAGRANRAIAAELSLSVRTVERHLANLYAKIGAANRAEAAAYAVRRGLA